MGEGVTLAVHAIGFLAQHAFHVGIGIGVLGVAGIDVALAAEPCLKCQALLRAQAPGKLAIEVFVAHAFTAGRQGAGLFAGTQRLVTLVDIPVICIGLGHVAIQPIAEVLG
ncbi:hypothetical protein D3C77_535600 [compost metagenome]